MGEIWARLEKNGETLETLEEIWGQDGYVYVRRETDTYVDCLRAGAINRTRGKESINAEAYLLVCHYLYEIKLRLVYLLQ